MSSRVASRISPRRTDPAVINRIIIVSSLGGQRDLRDVIRRRCGRDLVVASRPTTARYVFAVIALIVIHGDIFCTNSIDSADEFSVRGTIAVRGAGCVQNSFPLSVKDSFDFVQTVRRCKPTATSVSDVCSFSL